jgi:adenylyl-sulfate kinase
VSAPVFWFLGLSASGKSTLARAAIDHLRARGGAGTGVSRWELLDGDTVREFLTPDIGYGFADRRRAVRVMGLLAHTLARQGIGVVVANIAGFQDLRAFMRANIPGYVEIYCSCPLSVCMDRDPKGLYKRHLADGLGDVVGLDIPFQEPETPDLVVDTATVSLETSLLVVRTFLDERGARGR